MPKHIEIEMKQIQKWLEQIFEKQKGLFNQEALSLYIAPQVIRNQQDKEPEDAYKTIQAWLKDGGHPNLLLLGDSGAGKTIFNQWLTQTLFEGILKNYTRQPIPLFIPLLAQRSPSKNLLLDYCRDTLRLNEEAIEWLEQQPLLLILDGFDELHERENLYRSNELFKLNAKVLISCRSQALTNISDYKILFTPCNAKGEYIRHQLAEWTIAPFDMKQIDAYLTRYIEQNAKEIKDWMVAHPDSSPWLELKTYQDTFQKFLSLQELITSPFVLHLVAEVLPGMMLQKEIKLARLNLYEVFVQQWFERQRQKLLQAKHINELTPISEAYQNYRENSLN